jgi:hypothetical protein
MEWWEGAILIVGGIWLVGRMSRQSPNHPLNAGGGGGSYSAGGGGCNSCGGSSTPEPTAPQRMTFATPGLHPIIAAGPTRGTNTDGSSALIAGESLSAPAGAIMSSGAIPAGSIPIRRGPGVTITPNRKTFFGTVLNNQVIGERLTQ